MAEGLGIAASVIAVIQLAAKAASLSYDYINGVKHATDDLMKFKNELESLNSVLTTLQDCANASPESVALRKLDAPLRECITEMKALHTKLEPKGWLRKNLARYKWPLKEKETSKHLLKIERLKSTFSLAIDANRLSHSRIIETRTKLIEKSVEEMNAGRQGDAVVQADEKRMRVLDWIYPREYDKRHIEISNRRRDHTGHWLLKSPEVLDWGKENPTSRLLWGYGIPGAGKTFLSSLMIDDLRSRAAAEGYGVAYIYFNHKEQEHQTPTHMLSSLVKQFACQIRHLPKEIDNLYQKLQPKQERPTLEDLYTVLLAVIKLFARSQVFIIYDALDECDQDTQRVKLLPMFHQMGRDGMSLFLTSRDYPEDIQRSLQGSAKIKLSAKDEDITSYIEQKIAENPRAEGLVRQGNCKEKIISELKKCANGMFLLVHFHIKYLCQQTTARQMLDELERLKGSSSEDSPMNPTYNRVMEIIRLQPKNCTQLAYNILSWLTKARRVLSVRELQQAVSVEQNRTTFDELALPNIKTMLDVCASLITIDEDSDTVRLVHYTVQEYIEKNAIIPEDANFRLAMACTTFLSYDVFSEGPCTSYNSLEARRAMYPFFYYAVPHLPFYLKECDEALSMNLVLRFLGSSQNVLSYLQNAIGYDQINLEYLQHHTKYTLLHVVANLGHLSAAQHLIEGGADVSIKNYSGETALHIAAGGGHDLVIELLLENGASLSDIGEEGRTPLHYAARYGRESTVRLLLERGAEPSVIDQYESTPLHEVATLGKESAAQFLLEKGADLSAINNSGLTPLHNAAVHGNEPVVRLFLDNGADPSSTDKNGSTLLHYVVKCRDISVAKLLIERGADISAMDMEGSTPLHSAVALKGEPIVRLLLDKGADLLAANNWGATPLHYEVTNKDSSITQLLLEKGADISATDQSGSTPLHKAAAFGGDSTVQLLLDKGADISVANRKESTPLHYAAKYGNLSTSKLLVEKGANISATNKFGSTPLHKATSRSSWGYASLLLVRFLIDKGADLSATDDEGSTPLHKAAILGDEAIIEILLEKGADISATNKFGSTPLHEAAITFGGSESVVRLLLDNGADISATNNKGSTPLLIAAFGNEPAFRVLLDKGADIWLTDKDGSTPLHQAAIYGGTPTAKLLIEKGVDISATDKFGSTPLHNAAAKLFGDESMVQLLLDNGADISAMDSEGSTPLHKAAARGRGRAARLLLGKGADISVTDQFGSTPLHKAAAGFWEDESMIHLLLEKGANISVVDSKGQTALEIAIENNKNKVAKVLSAQVRDQV